MSRATTEWHMTMMKTQQKRARRLPSASINTTIVGLITAIPLNCADFISFFFICYYFSPLSQNENSSHINRKRKYFVSPFLRNDVSGLEELVSIQVNRSCFKRNKKRRKVSLASNMTFRGNSLIVLSGGSQDDCWLVMLFGRDNSWERGRWKKGARLDHVNFPLLQHEQTASTLVLLCIHSYSERYEWGATHTFTLLFLLIIKILLKFARVWTTRSEMD